VEQARKCTVLAQVNAALNGAGAEQGKHGVEHTVRLDMAIAGRYVNLMKCIINPRICSTELIMVLKGDYSSGIVRRV
jgi:hypothetical protein